MQIVLRFTILVTLAAVQLACGTAAFVPNTTTPTEAQVLFSTTVIDPGTRCPYGGKALDVGSDTNSNGALDPNEVTGSTDLCNSEGATFEAVDQVSGPEFAGNLTINNSGDVALLGNVTVMYGNLTIQSPNNVLLHFPNLVTIHGTLTFLTPGVTLTGVQNADTVHVATNSMTPVVLPNLQTAKNFYATGSVVASALTSVSSFLQINTNMPAAVAMTASFPALTTVNNLVTYGVTTDASGTPLTNLNGVFGALTQITNASINGQVAHDYNICVPAADGSIACQTASAPEQSYTSLHGLESVSYMSNLALTNDNQLTDLSAMGNSNVVTVNITSNPNLVNITGLNFTKLRNLALITQPSITSLPANMTALTSITLVESPIGDLSPLAGNNNLSVVSFDTCPITSLASVKNPNLTSVSLRDISGITSLSELSGTTKLTIIQLSGLQIADLSPIAGNTFSTVYVADDNVLITSANQSPLRVSIYAQVSFQDTNACNTSVVAMCNAASSGYCTNARNKGC